ncbi:MAG: hypothetical protein ACRDE2_08895 [Chitinophagaceae bacterium]
MKKILFILPLSAILFIGSGFKGSSSNDTHFVLNNFEQNTQKDYAFYVGYFNYSSGTFPGISGKVNVYCEDVRTTNSEVLTGKLIVNGTPYAFNATGYYYYELNGNVVDYVSNFDGYVSVNGTQYHIQYTGSLIYP